MVLRSCICLFCSILVLTSCSSSPEKAKVEKAKAEEITFASNLDTVVIAQMQFQPALLTVHKGDTVVFVNKGIVNHDVTERVNKAWTSGELPVGTSWKFVPAKSSDYFCSIHVVMKGKIIVE